MYPYDTPKAWESNQDKLIIDVDINTFDAETKKIDKYDNLELYMENITFIITGIENITGHIPTEQKRENVENYDVKWNANKINLSNSKEGSSKIEKYASTLLDAYWAKHAKKKKKK